MNDRRPVQAILAALGHKRDFSALTALPDPDTQAGRILLQWLDRSGLALPFWCQLQIHNVAAQISNPWRQALQLRREHNHARAQDMFEEAQRIHSAFLSFGVNAAAMKGFTLTPDFCHDPYLRHQVDFDYLVAANSVNAAAEALRSCGYSTACLNESGESCFLTPLKHVPSSRDDLYALQRQRQVDLHTSIWERCFWLPVEVPQDCLEHAQPQRICGVEFLSLSLEDKFLLQILHAFRHSFRSWIRLSWLWEIANCLENHRENVWLWNRVMHRAGSAQLMKSVFALVLGLVSQMFHTPIPWPLQSWTGKATTIPLRVWLDHFGFDWAVSDWPGSLNNLFLTPEFIPDADLRSHYWRSRLLPGKAQASLGSLSSASPRTFLRLQAARISYLAQRAAVHLRDIAALPREQFRWKRALQSYRRPDIDSNY